MRHVYIRGILGVIWMGAAAVCGISGDFMMAAFYALTGGFCLYASGAEYRKQKVQKGGR